MSKHPDAVGYLYDLATEIDEQWFKLVCDLVVVGGLSALDDWTRDTLFALFTKQASYIGIKAAAVAAAAPAPAVPADRMEQLSGFANFKLLGDTLNVEFKKRINLIFGANGSGKSSLCDSFKALASTGQPNRPLENVRTAGATTPTFRYKFTSDVGPQAWTPATGYGPKSATIKYFDTAIAVQNVTNAVEPGRVIVVAPFKLYVFEWTKALIIQFREGLQRTQLDNSLRLARALQEIRADFMKFKGCPLALIDEKTVSTLTAQIKLGEEFKDQQLLGEKQAAVVEMEKATSEEGLKLLQAEHRELESLLEALNYLLASAAELWALESTNKAKSLLDKQTAQKVLAEELIPEGGTLDGLLALLHAASPMCKMDEAAGQACPLCKRDMGAPEDKLFKRYHALLDGVLEKEITAIKADLTRAREIVAAIRQIDRKEWDKNKMVPGEVLAAAKTGAELIVASCDILKEPTGEAKDALELLLSSVVTWTEQMESKMTAIDTAAKGRDELVKQLAELRAELEPLEYANAIASGLGRLHETQLMANNAEYWNENLPAFTRVLKRITETAKTAHEELVVSDFEARLDAEYKALAEKDMMAFGVKLARKGADASVTVLPQIGGRSIEGIMSEGEQRIHALALFFAELETCAQSVLVFDDPVSSFDYNYIANYCARLRDFALKFPDRQIIVLTHNWEFFAQFQATLNSGGLNAVLSVQVLENCSMVAEYSEKLDELKADINAILALTGEPRKPQKEELAGKMRRLIEAVVNTHVFNSQRQQYKQRKHSVSEFHHYTKLVRLEPAEATTLRDLYAKLSITEHDDARNAYVNTDKATFQNRYNSILAIEAAVVSRR